jgi:NYN domain
MANFAVFVDAGYLLAWGADVRVGARAPRTAVQFDHGPLIKALTDRCGPLCSRELLRVYWYDGAPGHVPTDDHIAIGQEDSVKVRLGRLTGGAQKGVDTLIVLDLTTLARERAISAAFVLSGDEDLREAVLVAQQLGVRVFLLCLAPTQGGQGRQAETLRREADACIDVSEVVEPFFDHVSSPPYLAGTAFGQSWLGSASLAELADLHVAKAAELPTIPQAVDRLLGTSVVHALAPQPLTGPPRGLQLWQRMEARRGFWDAISQHDLVATR